MNKNRKSFWIELAYCCAAATVVALAVWLRFDGLEQRPMHTDEAVQAAITGILVSGDGYEYNAAEFHGPTLHFVSAMVFRLKGVTSYRAMAEWTLRSVTAGFGVGLVVLTLLAGGAIGRWPALWAALFVAVSHGLTFYSRYYIHETLLVFFTMATLLSGWCYTRTGGAGWALLCGACAALMGATKETAIIAWAAMIDGAVIIYVLRHCRRQQDDKPSEANQADAESNGLMDSSENDQADIEAENRRQSTALYHQRYAGAIGFLLGFIVIWIVLFTVFFTQWENLPRSLTAFFEYAGRAMAGTDRVDGAGEHRHAWFFYLLRLLFFKCGDGVWFSEAPLFMLAMLGALACIRRSWLPDETDVGFTRVLAIFCALLLLIYSLTPYKTPWCVAGVLHCFALLGGVGVCYVLKAIGNVRYWKFLTVCATLALSLQMLHQTRQGVTRYAADFRNPYVYAHTSSDLLSMTRLIDALRDIYPEHERMPIRVITDGPDYWPLPWYLRSYQRVGYHTSPPKRADAAIVIVQSELDDAVRKTLLEKYSISIYGLRPAVLLRMYVRQDLWEAHHAKQERLLREKLEEEKE